MAIAAHDRNAILAAAWAAAPYCHARLASADVRVTNTQDSMNDEELPAVFILGVFRSQVDGLAGQVDIALLEGLHFGDAPAAKIQEAMASRR